MGGYEKVHDRIKQTDGPQVSPFPSSRRST